MTHRRTDAGMAKGYEYGWDAVVKLDAAIVDSVAVPTCPATAAPTRPGTTLRVSSATPRAKTEYPWPGDYPHSHSASGVPLVDPRTTSRSTEMSSSLRGLL